MKRVGYTIVLISLITACKSKKTELVWNVDFSLIGSQSSPRATDLNGDGVLDLVMGAGKNEYEETDHGVIAIDGKSGRMLWNQKAKDQVYGSATLMDITKDGVEDILIGGRSDILMALNGKNGAIIWEYKFESSADSVLRNARFNFQNSVAIPDQNGDGIKDLLIQNGGNSKAAPGTMNDRFPGVLLIMDSATGKILFSDQMPDGKESYMPPLYLKQPDGKEWIVFGSGGETIDGKLYISELSGLKNRKLNQAKIIAQENGHGFIAPPVAADINEDGFLDIVAISHGSSIFAIDGNTFEPIWQRRIDFTECSNAFAVGNFNNDQIPDFFTFVSKGVWPDNKGSVQIMIDGKTGEIGYQNNLGCSGFSSPVVYDLNHDGIDEAIISINEFDCELGFNSVDKPDITNRLIALDFKTKKIQEINSQVKFKNIFTTPYIGDLDNDKYLDIVYCQYFNPTSNLLAFLGMNMKRISTHIKIRNEVKWGAYMGSAGNGIYQK